MQKNLTKKFLLNQELWLVWAKAREVIQVMDDLRSAKVDFITVDSIYNLLKHHPLSRYHPSDPKEFEDMKQRFPASVFLTVNSPLITQMMI